MKKIAFTGTATFILLSLGLNACQAVQTVPTPTPVDVNAIQTAVVQTVVAELTQLAPTITPTSTATPSPTMTRTPTITSTPTITPTATALKLSLDTNLAIYMININDQTVCSYTTFPIPINRGITGDMLTDIRIAVSYLLNTKWAYSGYLTNPLSTSNLYFSDIQVTGDNMKITLGGNISRYDDQCLNNEARDQLWATVQRYADPSITSISIWVDSLLFDDLMLRG